jgi:hypothetical protein
MALGLTGCSKDEKAVAQSDEETSGSPSTAGGAEDEGDDEDEDEDEAEAEAEEATGEAVDEEAALETPPAKPDKASTRIAGDAPGGDEPPRGDKARDRVKAVRDDGAPPTPPEAAAAEKKAEASREGDQATPGDAMPSSDGARNTSLLSPAERRKVERERRIAELKRRNEERRQARMAKVDDQRRESQAEASVQRENASVEARAPVQATPRAMSLKKYITESDVRKLLSDQALVEEGGLSGLAPSEGYNSVYFAPPVRSTFGVAVQVWRDKTRRDANVRFRRMRSQYANAEDTTAPTAKSFVSQWDDILTLSFANLTKRIVVSVSCSTTICKPAQLLSIAKTISAKL